ncbi:MAG: type II secretion system F family protein [bacterium]
MAKFKYIARDEKGKTKKGEMDAISEQQLAKTLKQDGLLLTHWEKERGKEGMLKKLTSWGSVGVKEKILFTNHLAMMLKAGVSISKAIGILAKQTNSKYFAKILNSINKDIQKGRSLAEAMAVHKNVFPTMFTSMVQAGEFSGRLEEVLKQLSTQMEKDHHLISKIRGAMTYPSIVVLAMIGVAIVMMTMVLPQLTDIFAGMDTELPFATRFLLAASDFTSNNLVLVIGGLVGLVVLFFMFIKTPFGKPIWHRVLIIFPLIGTLAKKVNLARFARTTASLLKSGISMVTTLEIVSSVLGNVHYKRAVEEASKKITKGVSLVSIFEKEPHLFPPMVTQMISIGEETGELDTILLQLAGFYEEEVADSTENMSSIIEPLLMIVMGVAVAFLALAIVQPIYSITSSF